MCFAHCAVLMGSVFRRRKRKVSVGRAWFNNQRLCWSRGQKATWRPAHLGHGSESRAVGDAEPARQDQKLQGVTTQPHQNRPAGGGEPRNPTPKTCSQKNACTKKNAPPQKKNRAAGLCRPPEHGQQGARRQSTLAQGSTQLHPSWPCFGPCAGGDGGMLETREAGILCTGSRL